MLKILSHSLQIALCAALACACAVVVVFALCAYIIWDLWRKQSHLPPKPPGISARVLISTGVVDMLYVNGIINSVAIFGSV